VKPARPRSRFPRRARPHALKCHGQRAETYHILNLLRGKLTGPFRPAAAGYHRIEAA
jgi:hypothetical protein